MTQNAVELLIKSHPLWHQVNPAHVPVTVKTMYTVLGRRMDRWHTILAKSDDKDAARRTMDAANTSGLFDRLVIAEGRSVNNAPADKWETIECAVPYSVVVTGTSFDTLLDRLKGIVANLNPETTTQAVPVTGQKQAFPILLGLACLFAAFNLNAPALCFVAVLALMDTFFLLHKRPLSQQQARDMNTTRHWAYAVLNGALLLPLVLKFIH